MTSDEMPECPLCMVELFYDDLGFYPCSCGYQICRFCWSKILNEENGLCPACRRAYDSEAPASFTPLSEEQFQKLKREKRQKDRKNKTIENRKHLADIRVVQKNLAFVIGLPQRFAEQVETLKSPEYFGKYGKVFKVVVNKNATQPGSQNQSTVGAYVTFVKGEDTIQAILDLNKQQMEGRTIKASLGTTKYCSQFLKGASCTKGECMYLHELGEEAASFTKEEMQQNKHTEYERKLIEDYIEQNGIASDSRLSSSSPSNSSQSQSSNQSMSQQNQNQTQNRLQNMSECRDHSSSSSSSNTPPSSRRQTKSESHTHRQSQHHTKSQRHPGGGTATSSGDSSVNSNTSLRTPRKNSQNYKPQPHGHSSHSRNSHGQKQQKRSSHQQNQQTHIQQTNPSMSNKQQSPPQSNEIQNPKAPQNSKFPTSCHATEVSSCNSSGDTSNVIATQEPQNSNPFTISTGLSISSGLVAFDDHNLQKDKEKGFNNVAVSGNKESIPLSSGSAATEASSSLQPSPALMPPPVQMRQPNQTMNGLTGSAVGMQPHQLPMYSHSAIQQIIDYQRQQLQHQQQQQKQQQDNRHKYQLMNSFESRSISSTSFPSEPVNRAKASADLNDERGFQTLSTPSKWPVTESSSIMPEANPVINSLADVAFSVHDDAANLDFDPVKESQQALAAMLEHERNHSAVGNMSACGTANYMPNSNPHNPGLAPPPGFEMVSPFSGLNRPSMMRPPNLNPCHPGMMGFGYYASGVPPGSFDMGLLGNSNRAEKGNNINVNGPDHSRHLSSVLSSTGSHSSAAAHNNSPALSFSVKALQDTLRCVLPEETKITFDPSLMREMQYSSMNIHATQDSSGTPSQMPADAIASSNNPPNLNQSSDAMASSSSKETSRLWSHNGFCMDDDPAVLASGPGANNSLQHEYCSLWPTNPSRKDVADDSDTCIRGDSVWSAPMTPPGFGTSVISLLGGLNSNNVHRVGVEGQRSAISVDAQTSVTATGDQQQTVNKI